MDDQNVAKTIAGKDGKLILSWNRIENEVRVLEERIGTEAFLGIAAIARGGLVPGILLAHRLCIKHVVSLGISSYQKQEQGPVCSFYHNAGLPQELLVTEGQGWLIIDDLVDSGLSMQYAKSLLPKAKTASLFAKPISLILPDFYAELISSDVWIVFPWENE